MQTAGIGVMAGAGVKKTGHPALWLSIFTILFRRGLGSPYEFIFMYISQRDSAIPTPTRDCSMQRLVPGTFLSHFFLAGVKVA